jgi:hypothetical protein
VLDTITQQTNQEGTGPDRRAELAEQLRRLQDLFIMRRQAVQDELERLAPPSPADPLAEAERVLSGLLELLGARALPH